MGLFGGSTRGLVGLDVGASAIKILVGTKTRSSFQVEKFIAVPLPARSIDDHGIINADVVMQACIQALEGLGKKKSAVATSVKGAGVLTKRLAIPLIPKKEIPDQVKWEAEQVFPQDVTNILIEHILLGEVQQLPMAPQGTKGWDIMLIGVRQDDARNLINVIESGSANVRVMDVDAFAVTDFLDGVVAIDKNIPTGFVDIGASATRVSVRLNTNVVFIREFPIGGNAFTDAISQAMGLSFEDAEAIKIQDGSGIPQEAMDAITNLLTAWKGELQSCEDIFVSQNGGDVVSKWYIYGGGSLTAGLLDSVRADRFGERAVPLGAHEFFKSAAKNVDPGLLAAWSARLISAAALSCRKA